MDSSAGDYNIPERLKAVRVKCGMTQSDFAMMLGVTREFVNMSENGLRAIKGKYIHDVCIACSVSADWILGIENGQYAGLSIEEVTGLTKESIQAIRRMDAKVLGGLNAFLSTLGREYKHEAY